MGHVRILSKRSLIVPHSGTHKNLKSQLRTEISWEYIAVSNRTHDLHYREEKADVLFGRQRKVAHGGIDNYPGRAIPFWDAPRLSIKRNLRRNETFERLIDRNRENQK